MATGFRLSPRGLPPVTMPMGLAHRDRLSRIPFLRVVGRGVRTVHTGRSVASTVTAIGPLAERRRRAA